MPSAIDSQHSLPDKNLSGDILVVDDRKENLDILGEILRADGHKVRPVSSGAMALVAAKERKPDIILLDISMPEMSGFELCRRLKKEDFLRDVPILFISALHETESKILAFEMGGSDYITKPFRIEEVQARVSTHLKLHHLHRALLLQNQHLDEARQRLEELQGMQDNLTHMIVHDLRSPLTGIVASLRFIEEDATSGAEIELNDIKQALESARRLTNLVNDLLDINRMEAAQLPLEIADVDLSAITSDAIRMLGPGKSARVLFEMDQVPLVPGDRDLLTRTVMNLLDNAFKYSPEGSAVEIQTGFEQNGWYVRVLDRGPGIPDEYKPAIFEKWGQLEARKSKLPSTGLGLAFCRLAVEAHGGHIQVKDRPMGGSVFEVLLPGEPIVPPASTSQP